MKEMYVIQEETGTKPAHVLKVRVTVDGKFAFIHPKGQGKRAEVTASTNVFKTEAEACKALTKGGKLMWVLDLDTWKGKLQLVQAYVHSYRKHWGTGFGRTFVDETGHNLHFHHGYAYDKRPDALKHLARKMGDFEVETLKKEKEARSAREGFEAAKALLRKARIGWTKHKK